jgi:diaminopimelate decarboxylase
MDSFHYHYGVYCAEDVPLTTLAERHGTPCYVYSRATLERHWHAFDRALGDQPHLICYAVKANSNLAVLHTLAQLGSGFDIVSGGELERVLRAGGQPQKIVFSGVGKTRAEIQRALQVGIHCFNVESEAELYRLNEIAGFLGLRAPMSLRVNPDVDAQTHPYIATGLKENKFGIVVEDALALYQQAAQLPHINIIGIDCHIGSQLTDIALFIDALQRVLALVEQLKTLGIELKHIDMGGGLGVRYQNETPPEPSALAHAFTQVLGKNNPYTLILEPGRAIIANAGVLLTRVEFIKHTAHKNFVVVDAAMNDLIRPMLYQAWQAVLPVIFTDARHAPHYDVVGPICETGDFLAKDRQLNVQSDDLLVIRSAGAYGFAMSSNYNSRPRVAEVLVDGDQHRLVRRRETLDDLLALESL